jgi:hypothetical protein
VFFVSHWAFTKAALDFRVFNENGIEALLGSSGFDESDELKNAP